MCCAPEVYQNIIGEKADVYSLGLIYRQFLAFNIKSKAYSGKAKNASLAAKL